MNVSCLGDIEVKVSAVSSVLYVTFIMMCVTTVQGGKEGTNQGIMTQLHCTAGLADLATRKYKSAARYFLQANFDLCDFAHVSFEIGVTLHM